MMVFRWKLSKNGASQKESSGRNEQNVRTNYLRQHFLSWGCIYYITLFILSVLGLTISGAFFSFHMLHIAYQNQLLRRVIMAVTLNGKQVALLPNVCTRIPMGSTNIPIANIKWVCYQTFVPQSKRQWAAAHTRWHFQLRHMLTLY